MQHQNNVMGRASDGRGKGWFEFDHARQVLPKLSNRQVKAVLGPMISPVHVTAKQYGEYQQNQ